MKRLTLAALYTAALMLANPATADVEAAKEAATGDMRKMLIFHAEPKPVATVDFMTFDGAPLNCRTGRANGWC